MGTKQDQGLSHHEASINAGNYDDSNVQTSIETNHSTYSKGGGKISNNTNNNGNSFTSSKAVGLDSDFEKLSINTNIIADMKETDLSSTDLFARINSEEFEIFHCISLLQSNPNIAIQYYICKRIEKFPIGELRFFAPQFLQLLVTMENQSMALEEMIKDICSSDPHFSLITFWHLQAMLQDLSKEPESIGFQTCKRLVNELQYQLFNYSSSKKTTNSSFASSSGVIPKFEINKDFKPNVLPSIVLASSILSGITVPESTSYVSPIVKMEGKRIKTMVFEVVKDIKKNLTENLTKKNTLNNALLGKSEHKGNILRRTRSIANVHKKRSTSPMPESIRKSSDSVKASRNRDLGFEMIEAYSDLNLPNLRKPSLRGNYFPSKGLHHMHSSSSINDINDSSAQAESESKKTSFDHAHNLAKSMPDLHGNDEAMSDTNTNVSFSPNTSYADFSNNYASDTGSYASSIRNSSDYKDSFEMPDTNSNSSATKPHQYVTLNEEQKKKLLKSSYFKNETQFVIALQNISIRLSKVPKEARLSTLKAELSILNKDLPCEIDIPMLLPRAKKGKMHKICRIAINESAVLNSAERVPYLILIEYLTDEADFDPSTPSNRSILRHIEDYEDLGGSDKYKFDLSYNSSNRIASTASTAEMSTLKKGDFDVVEEGDLADVSIVKMTNNYEKFRNTSVMTQVDSLQNMIKNDTSSNLPIPPLTAQSDKENNIATQLRIASIMLTQLESSSSPLPQHQSLQIKNKIINSMQTMQEGFANNIDTEGAGERKLSNDMKVAGLSYLGEDWETKKARIRQESKFGHLENWDLFSMIAKTGDDLAQEAFACQLIHLMANIWYQDKVKVWVKRMKILVTSISTGLVETITNAVSVHSIKKALEQDMIKKNEQPINGVISLKDHFRRLFGEENSRRYKLAQDNFASSLAAYSVICYILQIKDRHNGNIMFDSEGHIVHIDFGFLLSNSPGSVGFESAPFKLTQEYVDVLGGVESYHFKKFKRLTKEAFKSLRRNADCIINMVELMQTDSSLPCFKAGENTSVLLRQRFQLHLTDEEVDLFIDNFLINKSLNSAYTRLYDQFQLLTQGIYI